jgi:hypothetical protein
MSPEERKTQTKKYESAGPQGQGPQQSFPNKDPQGLTAEDMAKCVAIAKEEPAGWTPQEAESKMPDQLNRTDRTTKDASEGSALDEQGFDYTKDEVQPPYQEGVTDDEASGGEEDIGGGNDVPEGSVGIDEAVAKAANPGENPMGPKTPVPGMVAKASKDGGLIHIPAFRMPFVATPKPGFESTDGPILIKAVTLEEGLNINKWKVRPGQFQRVADAYKSGRQLRTDHSKDMDKVIGKSYNGMVMKGAELPQWLGTSIQGINPGENYVVAEFEANPRNPQVRTNILQGYVDTGSIGLDAKAYCAECGLPLKANTESEEMERTCRHYDAGVELDDVDVKEYSYVAEPAFEHTMAFPSFSAAVSSSLSRLHRKSQSVSTSSQRLPATAAKKAEAKGEGDADADLPDPGYGDLKLKMYRKGYADALADAAKFRAVDVPPNKPGNIAEGDANAEGKQDDFDRPTAEAEAEGESEGVGEADAGAVTPGKPPSQFPDSDQLKGTPQQLGPGTFRQITVPNPDSTHPVQGRRTDQVGRMVGRGTKNGPAGATLMDIAWKGTAVALRDPAMRELFKASANLPDTPAEIKQKLGRKDLRWE